MQRVHSHVASGEFRREVDGEHDLGELALAVGPDAFIAALQHHVGKVDGLLSDRGDVDDARRFFAAEAGQQPPREQEAGEIVDGEAQLKTVGALFALPAAEADAGVVDEDVETLMFAADNFGKTPHRGERRKIRGVESRGSSPPADVLRHSFAAL